jgi:Periplasmic protease
LCDSFIIVALAGCVPSTHKAELYQHNSSGEFKLTKEALLLIEKYYIDNVKPVELLKKTIEKYKNTVASDLQITEQEGGVLRVSCRDKMMTVVQVSGFDNNDLIDSFKQFQPLLNECIGARHVKEIEEYEYSLLDRILSSLDSQSSFISPDVVKEMFRGTREEFAAIGIETTKEGETLSVIAPVESGPAAKAGIKPGDQIIAIDGKSTQEMTLVEAVGLLRGPKGSTVKISNKK